MINYAATLTKAGEYQLAITQYNEVLHSDPYNGCALYGMANVLDKTGQHEEAKKDYGLAKKLNPANAACGTDTTNSPPKVSPPSQARALSLGF